MRYLGHVNGRYATDEPQKIRLAIRPARLRYGFLPARDLGPLNLKVVRQEFVDLKLVRTQVNKRVRRIVQMFRWAVGEELVPVTVYQALKAVEGLRKGSPGVREARAVKAVPDAWVDAVLPFLNRQVRAMVELQRYGASRARSA